MKGYIYKISNPDMNENYIGSTSDYRKRIVSHKYNTNRCNSIGYNIPLYKFIRENGGWNNWESEIIEEIDYDNKELLRKKERNYINENPYSLNCVIPTRTKKEYYQDNKEKLKKYQREYERNKRERLKSQYPQ